MIKENLIALLSVRLYNGNQKQIKLSAGNNPGAVQGKENRRADDQ